MRNVRVLIILLIMAVPVSAAEQKTVLVFGGKTGWIGKKIVELLQGEYRVFCAESRLECRESVVQELNDIDPDFVINAAGVTGTPNIDWCEFHKQETLRSNIIGALTLADLCYQNNIHMTNLGTGCIYEYDEDHSMLSGKGFTELDEPNFTGSFYSATKVMLDKFLLCYPNVLNLRLRMPISTDLHPRNFITKISKYAKVINIPNSMTILDDLLPLMPYMMEKKLAGNYNFVNPGTISHNEILDLYKQYINPQFVYSNFTVEEQDKVLAARRSNNELNASKLLQVFPHIPSIQDSIVHVFEKMKENLK